MTHDADTPEWRDEPFRPGLPDPQERHTDLEDRAQQFAESITSHATVDQAVGIIVALGDLSPSQGRAVLVEVSRHTNIKVRHIAELVVDFGRTGRLCTDIRTELNSSLARRKVASPDCATAW